MGQQSGNLMKARAKESVGAEMTAAERRELDESRKPKPKGKPAGENLETAQLEPGDPEYDDQTAFIRRINELSLKHPGFRKDVKLSREVYDREAMLSQMKRK